MEKKYISFADGPSYYRENQNLLIEKYSKFGFTCKAYSGSDLENTFVRDNKKILSSSIGNGYWLWKPYIILKELTEMSNGDILLYTDCADDVISDPSKFIEDVLDSNDGMLIVETEYKNSQYTKKDCFVIMNCNEETYHNSNHMEAGICAFMKNEKSIKFVTEWLENCKNYESICNDTIINENHESYIAHRNDQSILTNLSIRNGIKTVPIAEMYKYFTYDSLNKKI
jgi:hypothetical protein